jgi:ankyrin repeat protein
MPVSLQPDAPDTNVAKSTGRGRRRALLISIPILLAGLAAVAAPRLIQMRDDGLVDAARRGDLAGVKSAIGYGADPNAALLPAIRRQKPEVVKYVLEHGAKVTQQVVLSAVTHESIPVIEIVLDHDPATSRRTPEDRAMLRDAAEHGQMDIVRYLLDDKRDPNIRGSGGTTMLMNAAAAGNAGMVRFLLAKNADVNAAADQGPTALIAAVEYRKHDVVPLLLAHGANVNARDKWGDGPLNWALRGRDNGAIVRQLIARGADVNARGRAGVTPLILAAQTQTVDTVRLLLDKRAALNAQDDQGNTPLSMAAGFGNSAIAYLLVERGANVNPTTKTVTPLMGAAQHGDAGLVRFLLDHGARVNDGAAGGAALLSAINSSYGKNDHTAIVALLLARGASPNLGPRSQSPLVTAAPRGKPELVRLLLDHGADVNAVDVNHMTPLLAAITMTGFGPVGDSARATVVKMLIDHGADVNARGKEDGRTPLFAAVEHGGDLTNFMPGAPTPVDFQKNAAIATEVVRTLLDHGARLDARDRLGTTPLQAAVSSSSVNTETINLLLARGADVNAPDPRGNTPLAIAIARREAIQNTLNSRHTAAPEGAQLLADQSKLPSAIHRQLDNVDDLIAVLRRAGAKQ